MDCCSPRMSPHLVIQGLWTLEPLDNALVRVQVPFNSDVPILDMEYRLIGLPRLLIPCLAPNLLCARTFAANTIQNWLGIKGTSNNFLILLQEESLKFTLELRLNLGFPAQPA